MCDRTQTPNPPGSPTSLILANKTKNLERIDSHRPKCRISSKKGNGISLSVAAGSAIIIQRFCPLPECTSNGKSSFLRKKYWLRHEEMIATGRFSRAIMSWMQSSEPKNEERIVKNKNLENMLRTCTRIVDDPPPPLVLIACISFAFAITAFRHFHRDDKYQDHIIGLALLGGISVAAISEEFLLSLKTSLPWSVIAGLVLSSLLHRFSGLGSRGRDNDRVYTNDERAYNDNEDLEKMRAHREGMSTETLDRRGSVSD